MLDMTCVVQASSEKKFKEVADAYEVGGKRVRVHVTCACESHVTGADGSGEEGQVGLHTHARTHAHAHTHTHSGSTTART